MRTSNEPTEDRLVRIESEIELKRIENSPPNSNRVHEHANSDFGRLFPAQRVRLDSSGQHQKNPGNRSANVSNNLSRLSKESKRLSDRRSDFENTFSKKFKKDKIKPKKESDQ